MTPERWQQIEKLYHAALECAPDERAAFLAEACAGDEALRHEVESLLAAHDQAGSFIESPPNDVAAEMFADEPARPGDLQTLGQYQILWQIGAGGMGEVYLARDTRLDRQVALKLLPAEFTQDQERLRRFVREARAASALNHPNIITIYEVGEIGETHFIASEFVEGGTLRQRMAGDRLKLHDALDAAIQVASALGAAHKAGIVHRDIKPENIMLRPDGLVKVLDFGLAKLTESQAPGAEPQAPTANGSSTEIGLVMGTLRYMSPEQARGLRVDARTDIFSLGVVLYEMITGGVPFDGETKSDVIAAILRGEPLPLASHCPETPRELQQILSRALRKDREARYQVVKDLELDLKSLKEEMEFETRLASARRSAASDEAVIETSGRRATIDTPLTATAPGSEGTGAVPIAGYLAGAISHHKRSAALALTALVVIIAGLAFAWSRWRWERSQAVPFRLEKITRITTSGKAVRVAISPDGKEIVYGLVEAGQQSLRLRQVDTGSEIRIVPPDRVDYRGITFSHNGNFVYYVRGEQNDSRGVLYRATKFGGSARRLLSNVDGSLSLSPDGKQLAFVRQSSRLGENILMVANEDGTGERELAIRQHPHTFRMNGPAWSPDGRLIACGSGNVIGSQTVVGVRIADGRAESLTSRRWETVGQVAWLPDGSGFVVVASEQQGYWTQIWHLSYPGGEAYRITRDLNSYSNVSLTGNSRILATVRGNSLINIWIAPNGDASRARQITTGERGEDGSRGLVWTPDDKIVYRSVAGGSPQLWIMEADGTGNMQLLVDTRHNYDPTVSPDGRYLVWSGSYTDIRHIWRMELGGSSLTQLTNGDGEWYPQYTPDGKWLIYQAMGSGSNDRELWKAPTGGGSPIQLTDKPAYAPVVSPDGQLIACNYRTQADAQIKLAVIPLEGGAPIKLFDMQESMIRPIRWMPDGQALAYVVTRGGVSNIWSQPLAGGQPKPLTDFRTQLIYNFAWSRDGRQLALSRGTDNHDVVLISDLR